MIMVRETRHLWIGNLPDNVREEQIRDLFQRHGRVQSVKFLSEDSSSSIPNIVGGNGVRTGKSATVAFIDIRSAAKALRAVHSMAGQPLQITYHEPGTVRNAPEGDSVAIASNETATNAVSSLPGPGISNGPNSVVPTSTPGVYRQRFPIQHGQSEDSSSHFYDQPKGSFRGHGFHARGRREHRHPYHNNNNNNNNNNSRHSFPGDRNYRMSWGYPNEGRFAPPAHSDADERTSAPPSSHPPQSENPTTPKSRRPDSPASSVSSRHVPNKRHKSRSVSESGSSSAGSRSRSGSRSSVSTSVSSGRSRSPPHHGSHYSRGNSPGARFHQNSYSRQRYSRSRLIIGRPADSSRVRHSRSPPMAASPSSSASSSPSPHRKISTAPHSPSHSPSSAKSYSPSRSLNHQSGHHHRRTPNSAELHSAIKIRNLPIRSSDTSLKDGLYHEYKKHGKVSWVRVIGAGTERFAIVCFKSSEHATRAVALSQDKQFFGNKIQVSAYYSGRSDEQLGTEEDNRGVENEEPTSVSFPTRTVLVTGLDATITPSELKAAFDQYGDIVTIDIRKQGATTHAVCEFVDIASAIRAQWGRHVFKTREARISFYRAPPSSSLLLDGTDGVNEKQITGHCSQYGAITRVIMDTERILALVQFDEISSAQTAIRELRSWVIKGKHLHVDFASSECIRMFLERIAGRGGSTTTPTLSNSVGTLKEGIRRANRRFTDSAVVAGSGGDERKSPCYSYRHANNVDFEGTKPMTQLRLDDETTSPPESQASIQQLRHGEVGNVISATGENSVMGYRRNRGFTSPVSPIGEDSLSSGGNVGGKSEHCNSKIDLSCHETDSAVVTSSSDVIENDINPNHDSSSMNGDDKHSNFESVRMSSSSKLSNKSNAVVVVDGVVSSTSPEPKTETVRKASPDPGIGMEPVPPHIITTGLMDPRKKSNENKIRRSSADSGSNVVQSTLYGQQGQYNNSHSSGEESDDRPGTPLCDENPESFVTENNNMTIKLPLRNVSKTDQPLSLPLPEFALQRHSTHYNHTNNNNNSSGHTHQYTNSRNNNVIPSSRDNSMFMMRLSRSSSETNIQSPIKSPVYDGGSASVMNSSASECDIFSPTPHLEIKTTTTTTTTTATTTTTNTSGSGHKNKINNVNSDRHSNTLTSLSSSNTSTNNKNNNNSNIKNINSNTSNSSSNNNSKSWNDVNSPELLSASRDSEENHGKRGKLKLSEVISDDSPKTTTAPTIVNIDDDDEIGHDVLVEEIVDKENRKVSNMHGEGLGSGLGGGHGGGSSCSDSEESGASPRRSPIGGSSLEQRIQKFYERYDQWNGIRTTVRSTVPLHQGAHSRLDNLGKSSTSSSMSTCTNTTASSNCSTSTNLSSNSNVSGVGGGESVTETTTTSSSVSRFVRTKHKVLDLDEMRHQPSDIVKSLLAKKSVFDEDTKRLENFGEKYEAKSVTLTGANWRLALNRSSSTSSTCSSIPHTPSPLTPVTPTVASSFPISTTLTTTNTTIPITNSTTTTTSTSNTATTTVTSNTTLSIPLVRNNNSSVVTSVPSSSPTTTTSVSTPTTITANSNSKSQFHLLSNHSGSPSVVGKPSVIKDLKDVSNSNNGNHTSIAPPSTPTITTTTTAITTTSCTTTTSNNNNNNNKDVGKSTMVSLSIPTTKSTSSSSSSSSSSSKSTKSNSSSKPRLQTDSVNKTISSSSSSLLTPPATSSNSGSNNNHNNNKLSAPLSPGHEHGSCSSNTTITNNTTNNSSLSNNNVTATSTTTSTTTTTTATITNSQRTNTNQKSPLLHHSTSLQVHSSNNNVVQSGIHLGIPRMVERSMSLDSKRSLTQNSASNVSSSAGCSPNSASNNVSPSPTITASSSLSSTATPLSSTLPNHHHHHPTANTPSRRISIDSSQSCSMFNEVQLPYSRKSSDSLDNLNNKVVTTKETFTTTTTSSSSSTKEKVKDNSKHIVHSTKDEFSHKNCATTTTIGGNNSGSNNNSSSLITKSDHPMVHQNRSDRETTVAIVASVQSPMIVSKDSKKEARDKKRRTSGSTVQASATATTSSSSSNNSNSVNNNNITPTTPTSANFKPEGTSTSSASSSSTTNKQSSTTTSSSSSGKDRKDKEKDSNKKTSNSEDVNSGSGGNIHNNHSHGKSNSSSKSKEEKDHSNENITTPSSSSSNTRDSHSHSRKDKDKDMNKMKRRLSSQDSEQGESKKIKMDKKDSSSSSGNKDATNTTTSSSTPSNIPPEQSPHVHHRSKHNSTSERRESRDSSSSVKDKDKGKDVGGKTESSMNSSSTGNTPSTTSSSKDHHHKSKTSSSSSSSSKHHHHGESKSSSSHSHKTSSSSSNNNNNNNEMTSSSSSSSKKKDKDKISPAKESSSSSSGKSKHSSSSSSTSGHGHNKKESSSSSNKSRSTNSKDGKSTKEKHGSTTIDSEDESTSMSNTLALTTTNNTTTSSSSTLDKENKDKDRDKGKDRGEKHDKRDSSIKRDRHKSGGDSSSAGMDSSSKSSRKQEKKKKRRYVIDETESSSDSDEDDEDKQKHHSIFEVVIDEYVSMYDKVKARSNRACKYNASSQQQKDEQSQSRKGDKLKDPLHHLKQSRAKREEKKRSTEEQKSFANTSSDDESMKHDSDAESSTLKHGLERDRDRDRHRDSREPTMIPSSDDERHHEINTEDHKGSSNKSSTSKSHHQKSSKSKSSKGKSSSSSGSSKQKGRRSNKSSPTGGTSFPSTSSIFFSHSDEDSRTSSPPITKKMKIKHQFPTTTTTSTNVMSTTSIISHPSLDTKSSDDSMSDFDDSNVIMSNVNTKPLSTKSKYNVNASSTPITTTTTPSNSIIDNKSSLKSSKKFRMADIYSDSDSSVRSNRGGSTSNNKHVATATPTKSKSMKDNKSGKQKSLDLKKSLFDDSSESSANEDHHPTITPSRVTKKEKEISIKETPTSINTNNNNNNMSSTITTSSSSSSSKSKNKDREKENKSGRKRHSHSLSVSSNKSSSSSSSKGSRKQRVNSGEINSVFPETPTTSKRESSTAMKDALFGPMSPTMSCSDNDEKPLLEHERPKTPTPMVLPSLSNTINNNNNLNSSSSSASSMTTPIAAVAITTTTPHNNNIAPSSILCTNKYEDTPVSSKMKSKKDSSSSSSSRSKQRKSGSSISLLSHSFSHSSVDDVSMDSQLTTPPIITSSSSGKTSEKKKKKHHREKKSKRNDTSHDTSNISLSATTTSSIITTTTPTTAATSSGFEHVKVKNENVDLDSLFNSPTSSPKAHEVPDRVIVKKEELLTSTSSSSSCSIPNVSPLAEHSMLNIDIPSSTTSFLCGKRISPNTNIIIESKILEKEKKRQDSDLEDDSVSNMKSMFSTDDDDDDDDNKLKIDINEAIMASDDQPDEPELEVELDKKRKSIERENHHHHHEDDEEDAEKKRRSEEEEKKLHCLFEQDKAIESIVLLDRKTPPPVGGVDVGDVSPKDEIPKDETTISQEETEDAVAALLETLEGDDHATNEDNDNPLEKSSSPPTIIMEEGAGSINGDQDQVEMTPPAPVDILIPENEKGESWYDTKSPKDLQIDEGVEIVHENEENETPEDNEMNVNSPSLSRESGHEGLPKTPEIRSDDEMSMGIKSIPEQQQQHHHHQFTTGDVLLDVAKPGSRAGSRKSSRQHSNDTIPGDENVNNANQSSSSADIYEFHDSDDDTTSTSRSKPTVPIPTIKSPLLSSPGAGTAAGAVVVSSSDLHVINNTIMTSPITTTISTPVSNTLSVPLPTITPGIIPLPSQVATLTTSITTFTSTITTTTTMAGTSAVVVSTPVTTTTSSLSSPTSISQGTIIQPPKVIIPPVMKSEAKLTSPPCHPHQPPPPVFIAHAHAATISMMNSPPIHPPPVLSSTITTTPTIHHPDGKPSIVLTTPPPSTSSIPNIPHPPTSTGPRSQRSTVDETIEEVIRMVQNETLVDPIISTPTLKVSGGATLTRARSRSKSKDSPIVDDLNNSNMIGSGGSTLLLNSSSNSATITPVMGKVLLTTKPSESSPSSRRSNNNTPAPHHPPTSSTEFLPSSHVLRAGEKGPEMETLIDPKTGLLIPVMRQSDEYVEYVDPVLRQHHMMFGPSAGNITPAHVGQQHLPPHALQRQPNQHGMPHQTLVIQQRAMTPAPPMSPAPSHQISSHSPHLQHPVPMQHYQQQQQQQLGKNNNSSGVSPKTAVIYTSSGPFIPNNKGFPPQVTTGPSSSSPNNNTATNINNNLGVVSANYQVGKGPTATPSISKPNFMGPQQQQQQQPPQGMPYHLMRPGEQQQQRPGMQTSNIRPPLLPGQQLAGSQSQLVRIPQIPSATTITKINASEEQQRKSTIIQHPNPVILTTTSAQQPSQSAQSLSGSSIVRSSVPSPHPQQQHSQQPIQLQHAELLRMGGGRIMDRKDENPSIVSRAVGGESFGPPRVEIGGSVVVTASSPKAGRVPQQTHEQATPQTLTPQQQQRIINQVMSYDPTLGDVRALPSRPLSQQQPETHYPTSHQQPVVYPSHFIPVSSAASSSVVGPVPTNLPGQSPYGLSRPSPSDKILQQQQQQQYEKHDKRGSLTPELHSMGGATLTLINPERGTGSQSVQIPVHHIPPHLASPHASEQRGAESPLAYTTSRHIYGQPPPPVPAHHRQTFSNPYADFDERPYSNSPTYPQYDPHRVMDREVLQRAPSPYGGIVSRPPPAHSSRYGIHPIPAEASTGPRLSQSPPPSQASQDSLLMLLQRYPIMWQGSLALKNDSAQCQMHFVSGNVNVARDSLPTPDGIITPLRISQRMRLEQTQLEGVARKMMLEPEHCMLLALPCGRDHMDVLNQSNNLRNGFITYLQLKQAAGIVNIVHPITQQPAYVIHIFPSCDFANENLARIAPDLLSGVADIAHLLIVIATV